MDINSSPEWMAWTADNLSRGVPRETVREELEKHGARDAPTLIGTVLSNPLYQVVVRQRGQLNRWAKLMRDLEELEFGPRSSYKIAIRSGDDDFDFISEYVSRNRPLLINDWVSKWPACKKWSFDYFSEVLGDVLVSYQDRTGVIDHLSSFENHTVKGSFKQFAERVWQSHNVYLIAHDKAFEIKAFRHLLLDIPDEPRFLSDSQRSAGIFLWMGAKGATTHMHRDLDNGIVAQVVGRRRFILIPSRQMDLVYNSSGFISDVDFKNLNEEKFPDLKAASIIRGFIEPGQALFLPLGWWHYFEAIEPTISLTFANIRRRKS